MIIRKAAEKDIPSVVTVYEAVHTAEEEGRAVIGWVRSVYPTKKTAEAAFARGDLFVMEDGGRIVGAAIINRMQCDGYETGAWQYPAKDHEVMVLHTLVIDPAEAGHGFGRAFVGFYEAYARQNGCRALRMDTNARNARARAMYQKLGYRETGMIDTVFNGIEGVKLVLLEKAL